MASEGPGGRRPWPAGDLRHPGIVAVRAHGQSGDTLWVATDLMPRGSLRQEIENAARRGIASLTDFQERLVRLVAGAAEALDHAHARGVAHEGIKLDNLLLGDDDRLLLVDFAPANSSGLEALSWLTEPAARSRAGDVQALAPVGGRCAWPEAACFFPALDASCGPSSPGRGPAARDRSRLLGDPGRRGRRIASKWLPIVP